MAAGASDNGAPANTDVEGLLKIINVFKDTLGVMNTFEAHLQLKEGAKSQFCKARSVPFAWKEAIDRELHRPVGS